MSIAPLQLPHLPSGKILFLFVASIIAACGLVYGSSLSNAFVLWNDSMMITKNPIVSHLSFHSIVSAFTSYDPELYTPLTFLSYQLDYLIGGLNPFVFHLDNLFLHILNAILVGWFVYLLSGKKWIALCTSLLFAVHPLNTETVVWASARKDLLSTFFFLSSFIAYVYYTDRRRTALYVLSLLLFCVGLLAKVTICVLPLLLLLADVGEHQRWNWALVRNKILYLGLSLIFCIVAVFGKSDALHVSSLAQKIVIPVKSIFFYVLKLILPVHLGILYTYNQYIHFFSMEVLLSVLILLLIIWAMYELWSRRRELSFGLIFFLITLAPTLLNFYKNEDVSFAADHYAYLPSVGFLYFVCLCLYRLSDRVASPARYLQNISVAVGAMIILFGILSFRQAAVWKNTEALYLHTLNNDPDAASMYMNLSTLYLSENRTDEALVKANRLLLLRPFGRIHRLLADIYAKRQDAVEAEKEYTKAIALEPTNPENYVGYGYYFITQARYQEAIPLYLKAESLNPHYMNAENDLCGLYLKTGDYVQAETHCRAVIALQPSVARTHYLLGVALEKQKRIDEAIPEYKVALSIEPTHIESLVSLARLEFYEGKNHEAAIYLQKAYSLDPNNPAVQSTLQTLNQMGTGL